MSLGDRKRNGGNAYLHHPEKENTMDKHPIAKMIFEQLHIRRLFTAMVGAKDYVATDNGLRFRIGKNSSKANRIEISLDPNDTYTITFARVAKGGYNALECIDNVYVDMMHDVIERYTGLYTTL